MSQNKYITNTFEKGLNLDSNPNNFIPGTYSYALNATIKDPDQVGVFGNENSNRLFCEFDSQIIGHGYIDEKDKWIIFTRNGLYLVDKQGEKEFIANDDEFGCNWNLDVCNWITPEIKTIDPCNETVVYWSSGCEYFKLNIDEMLSPERKAALKESMKPFKNQCSDITCEYFKVFKLSCAPKVSPVGYPRGGSLPCGAYQFAVKLKNNEGGETNWFTISDPVYIGSEHNQPGERSDGFIEVNLSALDCNYDYGELAVISTINGIVTAKLITRFNYVNDAYSYTYTGEEGDPIAIEEIIVKGKTYLEGQDLIQYNGNMLYYNIRQQKNLNYQRQANEIETSWVQYRVPYAIAKKYNLKSYMRGETYAFGIKFNSSDGRSTRVFHIPALGTSTNSGDNATSVPISTSPTAEIANGPDDEYRRTRTPKEDTVDDPQFDEFDSATTTQAEGATTDVTDGCDILTECEDCEEAAEHCNEDVPNIKEVITDFGDVLSSFGLDNPDDLSRDYASATPNEAGKKILESVEQRERTQTIKANVSVSKGDYAPMSENTETIEFSSLMAGLYFDAYGVPEIELQIDKVSLGPTIPKLEEDILYPDMKDCSGEYIYGDFANQQVRHHQVPWASDKPHYISNAIGVPSKYTPDADEYSDAYVDIIGPRFNNIHMPSEEELGFKLCERNPFTILQVPRTSKNKTIHSKGILTNLLRSSNDGKFYLYPSHGLNSEDSNVNRYIKIGDSRRDPNAILQNNYNFWSLDTMTKAHALNFTGVKLEGIASGIGQRHGLYERGKEPQDTFRGSRLDQRGARQGINLNAFERRTGFWSSVYRIYAPANEVVSPPAGAPYPLMNKYQQESVWLGANIPPIVDKSFKGDVLNHAAPITDAKAYYVALYRHLPNQYGDLTNMVYKPVLEAGFSNSGVIEGICGDIFIGFHSFIRTSYVSDKVGNKFPIGNMVPGKADRCVCDNPEDAIHSAAGKGITDLPKSGDKADARNWAGLHTNTTSHNWSTSNNEGTISDYYFPKTVKTLITYCGEFEVNPYLRQRGESLEDQVYKPLKREYGLDSSIDSNSGTGWENDYLNQFYWEDERPSRWKLIRKTLIRTIITHIAPILGVDMLLDGTAPLETVFTLGTAFFVIGIWNQLSKVLFSNHYIDELLGMPVCRTDDEGGEEDRYINNFFQNYKKHNPDLNSENKVEVFYGLPVPYYTCDCDNCDDTTTSEIFISDEQQQGSHLDAYSVVRPKNVINIPASKGTLTDIFINGTDLWAHTTEQLIPLRYGRVHQATSLGDIILGEGPILSKPVGISEGVYEGRAGLISPQHAINTQYGRVFVDYKAKKLFLFGESLIELSNTRVYNHFKNKLHYCEVGSCENEHIKPNDIALGIDPRTDRLLITKRGIGDDHWTMSYDFQLQQWISFHSYTPNFYIWDRANMISGTDTELWIHDVKCNYQTFMGKFYPHILEFNINDSDILNEVFKSALLYTDASKCQGCDSLNLLDRDVTYNTIWARNPYQTTGPLPTTFITPRKANKEDIEYRSSDKFEVALSKDNVLWSYNELKDRTKSIDSSMYEKQACGVEITPINFVDSMDPLSFKSNIHLNNHLFIRFIFDKFADYKLYTYSHLTLTNKKPELYG